MGPGAGDKEAFHAEGDDGIMGDEFREFRIIAGHEVVFGGFYAEDEAMSDTVVDEDRGLDE